MVTIEKMGSDPNAAHCRVPAEERLNVFALVIYIPGPLGLFLDELRRELVPAYNPHAHVSVLPPRPLKVDWHVAASQAGTLIESDSPFDVELGAVGIFPGTNVIYIEVGSGATELRRLHAEMNKTALGFDEPYRYHPHVTLAQEIPPDCVQAVYEKAVARWSGYPGKRSFRAENAVFVQNTMRNCWIDLAEYSLGAIAAKI
jgi:2'-5' RNA ligase